jgi:hypothetical protein
MLNFNGNHSCAEDKRCLLARGAPKKGDSTAIEWQMAQLIEKVAWTVAATVSD